MTMGTKYMSQMIQLHNYVCFNFYLIFLLTLFSCCSLTFEFKYSLLDWQEVLSFVTRFYEFVVNIHIWVLSSGVWFTQVRALRHPRHFVMNDLEGSLQMSGCECRALSKLSLMLLMLLEWVCGGGERGDATLEGEMKTQDAECWWDAWGKLVFSEYLELINIDKCLFMIHSFGLWLMCGDYLWQFSTKCCVVMCKGNSLDTDTDTDDGKTEHWIASDHSSSSAWPAIKGKEETNLNS